MDNVGASTPDVIHAQVAGAEHRPVQRLRERPQEARVQQRRRRPGGQVPVPAGQQRPRRLGVLVRERPEPGQHPAPGAGRSDTVSACIPASSSTLSAAASASSERSRSARHGWENV